jgi:hypothetical protein
MAKGRRVQGAGPQNPIFLKNIPVLETKVAYFLGKSGIDIGAGRRRANPLAVRAGANVSCRHRRASATRSCISQRAKGLPYMLDCVMRVGVGVEVLACVCF